MGVAIKTIKIFRLLEKSAETLCHQTCPSCILLIFCFLMYSNNLPVCCIDFHLVLGNQEAYGIFMLVKVPTFTKCFRILKFSISQHAIKIL